jgi:DNA replication protein DnaC|tara:strand:- start:284 stop:931 length:648 start_codon:yes stop_codon:yes gene_type:complete
MTTEEQERIDRVNDRFEQLARFSGMPRRTGETHLLMTFLPGRGNKEAHQAAIDFVTDKREHHFITLAGEVGRGKTHLALGIGWQWLGQGLGTVKYWQVSELLDAMRAEYDKKPEDDYGNPLKGQLEYCKDCSLLILDDLGTEKTTEWVADKLDALINHRWLEEKPTVFTTNLEPKQLLPRIRSRIKEGVVITLEGLDYREYKAKMRKAKEAKDAL